MSQESPAPHQAILEEPAASIDEAGAEEVAKGYFGLNATAKMLGGERDVNFMLNCVDGKSYLLKVSHPSEDSSIVDFQTQAMLWIEERGKEIPAQRVILATDGQYSRSINIAERDSVVRLMSFIDGVTWHDVHQPSERLSASLGTVLARLNRALNDFEHPAQNRVSLWDLKSAPEVAILAAHIPDLEVRENVQAHMAEFLRDVHSRLDQLPWQVIHGDINPRNVIVSNTDDDHLVGIIDFGDLVYSPRVFDLAVLCAYSFDVDGYRRVKAAAYAYNMVNPLTEAEKQVLLSSVKCRLCVMLCIAYWRSKLHPENIEYIQRSTQYATRALHMLSGYSQRQVDNDFASAFYRDTSL